jgi:hypothetical protein
VLRASHRLSYSLNKKQREFPAPPWAGVKRVTPARVPSLRYTVQPLPPTPLPSRRSHGVSTLPESATPEIRLPNLGILLQQVLTRIRLELPSDVRRTVFLVCLHKQVYVVIRDLQRHNLVSEVVRSGPKWSAVVRSGPKSPQTTLAHRPPLHPEPGVDTLGTRRSDTYRN